MVTTAAGPPCRAAREDEVIARLLQHPEDTHLRDIVDQGAWTSHLRAQMFRATRPAGGGIRRLGDIRVTMEHWLLRAPGWALPMIGWPDAHRAMGYFDRLLATPVTSAQAVAAAQALGRKPEPATQAAGTRALAVATTPAPSAVPVQAVPTQARQALQPAAMEQPAALPDAVVLIPRRWNFSEENYMLA
jgi:hypothetical protein